MTERQKCPECGAYRTLDDDEAHAPKCSLASVQYRASQADLYYDAWLRDSRQHEKLRAFWKEQVTLWQGKCLILRHENNKLRRKLRKI